MIMGSVCISTRSMVTVMMRVADGMESPTDVEGAAAIVMSDEDVTCMA